MYAKLLMAAVLATTVTGAQAMIGHNGFTSLHRFQEEQSVVDIGRVLIERDGTVELYVKGPDGSQTLIGTQRLHAGANSNVRVPLSQPMRRDVTAVLRVDGQIVATRQFEVINR
ncbi:hypothetical protein T8T21_07460 [Limimaricola variabilis]|uniref:hypothetical protein n=1 Tax=Limimaricola variabilis TaxID=1492771 RepID=UPI002AC8C377|nr:hypothetical protein [Limimaricola variabilis]WPY95944.1 hypothetical protein T8T21_07460 [Limimaricola variabilis]